MLLGNSDPESVLILLRCVSGILLQVRERRWNLGHGFGNQNIARGHYDPLEIN